MAHPPPSRQPNPLFAGRDWRDVRLGELVALNPDEVRWVDMESSVEEATMLLVKGAAAGNCVMIKDGPLKQPVSFFDYNDLNAYLVAVVGLAKPDEEHVQLYDSLAKRAQDRVAIPMRDIQPICRHEQLVSLPPDEFLPGAIEVFGSGIHRLLVTTQEGETIGVMSQLKLLEFFWNEGINFPLIDVLYPSMLKDLQIGSQQIIAIKYVLPPTQLSKITNISQRRLNPRRSPRNNVQRRPHLPGRNRRREKRRRQHLYLRHPPPHLRSIHAAPPAKLHALHHRDSFRAGHG